LWVNGFHLIDGWCAAGQGVTVVAPSTTHSEADMREPLEHIVTFCGQCNCGCPELFLDHDADEERRVVITDDFGARIQMSLAQLHDLVSDVKEGALDKLFAS
jgi:hypothetical protein